MNGLAIARRVASLVVGFAAGFGFQSAVAGVLDVEGRASESTSIDGASVYLNAHAFYAAANTCVVYSLLVETTSGSRHLESGLLRCNSEDINNECFDNHKVIEQLNSTGFHCHEVGSFDKDNAYYAWTQRNSSGSDQFTAHFGNDSFIVGNFGQDSTLTYTWAEEVGQSQNCPGAASATFQLWQKYKYGGGGWSTVSNSNKLSQAVISPAPCWTVHAVNSNGTYDVD